MIFQPIGAEIMGQVTYGGKRGDLGSNFLLGHELWATLTTREIGTAQEIH